jgi:hypothetical protein
MTYARWGDTFYKYGNTSRLYGAGVEDANLHWAIEVDWNGDSSYDGTNEGQYAIDMVTRRGREFYIQVTSDGNASGFGEVLVGTANIELDNNTGRFDPYNTISPIYGYILPGRYIRVRVEYNGVIYPVFAGKIRNIVPHTQQDGSKTVTIECEDGMRLLQGAESLNAIQTDIDIDDAIGLVLDDVNWPTVWGRDLDDSADVIPYWWSSGVARNTINELASAELGYFFVDNQGRAAFNSRHHTETAVATMTQSDILREIEQLQPWEAVRNLIRVVAHPLVAQATGNLWEMGDKPLINNGESLVVWAPYAYNNVPVSAINVLTPVATTDYTANTAQDGSGTDKTSGFAVSRIDYGAQAKITWVNNSGSNAYLTLGKIRGDALYSASASVSQQENTTSQAAYGKLSFRLDSPWLQDSNLIADFSAWLISFLATPQNFLTVQVQGRPDIQFTPDLFDTVSQSVAKLSIAATNFHVGYIEHHWNHQNGQDVITTWKYEPFQSIEGYWIFDIVTGNVQMGVNTIFGL